MIKINVQKKDNRIIYFKIEGHANAAEYGEDIICAAVSSVGQMTLNGMIEILEMKNLSYKEMEGLIECDLKSSKITENEFIKASILTDSMISYLKDIAENYPEFVKLKIKEVIK